MLTTSVNLLGIVAAPVALVVFGGGVTTVAVVNLAASILLVAGNLVLAVRLQRPSFIPGSTRLSSGGSWAMAALSP